MGTQKTVEQLTKELEKATREAADNLDLAKMAEAKCQETQKEANDLEAKLAQITKLGDENEALTVVNEKLQEKIVELSGPKNIPDAAKKAEQVKPLVLPKEEFESGGEKYVFISPVFTFKRQRIVAEEALLDQDLLDELVNSKVGCIKKV